MSQPCRLASGGLVDRSKSITFTFEGRRYGAFEGDTLASALLANGVGVVGRSFKFHRPRGIMAAGIEEPNGLVAIGSGRNLETNLRATEIELSEGLEAKGLNAWPSVRFDFGACADLFHRVLRAGFYYKTFMWPHWHWFEPLIRRAGGIGRASMEADCYRYERRNLVCDVLVVGGGPAGLAAAVTAARSGCRVVLIERQPIAGGVLLGSNDEIDGWAGAKWATGVAADLAQNPGVQLLYRTTAIGYFEQNHIVAVEQGRAGDPWRQRLWDIRARQVVLATGALERPLVFPDNDRPKIMLASAVREYLNRYSVCCGRKVAIVTNNDSAYLLASDLRSAGIPITAIVDIRPNPRGPLIDEALRHNTSVFLGYGVCRTFGRHGVRALEIARLGDPQKRLQINCDLIAMSGGWNPTVHLFSQSGGRLRYDGDLACFVPTQPLDGQLLAGAITGTFDLARCLGQGADAGEEAAHRCGFTQIPSSRWQCGEQSSLNIHPYWQTPAALAGQKRQWVDFQNDVTTADIAGAAAENFVSVEHLKRYTTLGMAPDQGKTSNVNGLAVLAEATGRDIGLVGTTTFRPPYTPVTFGAIAGRAAGALYYPQRLLPTHDQQQELNAVLEDYGSWLRPAYYPLASENEDASIAREVIAVRNGVGLCDYSPLGKIEVSGPDAERFLNRMLVVDVTSLKRGSARYNLILSEAGIVIDDGIVSRLSDDHFLVGTTSGGASRIAAMFEEWHQCEWPDLQVFIHNATTAWGTMLLTGPKTRELLSRLESDIDFSREAFPHMSVRSGRVAGVPARIHRVSFTGELSYELAVGTAYSQALWKHLMELGADVGLSPFGIESLLVMRTEKGFIHVGTDTDGTTLPGDIGLGGLAARKESDYVGRRSLQLDNAKRTDRLQIVGLEPLQQAVLPIGGQLLRDNARRFPTSSEGFITSSCLSPTLSKPVALGMLTAGRSRIGEELVVYSNGKRFKAKVTARTFYDAQGERLNA